MDANNFWGHFNQIKLDKKTRKTVDVSKRKFEASQLVRK